MHEHECLEGCSRQTKTAKQFTTIYIHINTMFVTSMLACSGLVVSVVRECQMPL